MSENKKMRGEVHFEKFTIDGKTYTSFDDIPDEFKKYLDKDGNGVVDVIENRNLDEIDGFEDEKVIKSKKEIHSVEVVNKPVHRNRKYEISDKVELYVWQLVLGAVVVFSLGYYLAANNLF